MDFDYRGHHCSMVELTRTDALVTYTLTVDGTLTDREPLLLVTDDTAALLLSGQQTIDSMISDGQIADNTAPAAS